MSHNPLIPLAVAIVIGALARYAVQLKSSAKYWSAPAADHAPRSFDLARRFAYALAAASIIQLVPVVLRSVMSFGAQGTVTAFNFAIKLVQLPNTIVVAALATVAFPIISEYVKSGEEGVTRTYVAERVRSSIGASVAITLPSIIFARPFVEVVYGHGKMTGGDLDLVAMLTQIGLVFLPFLAVSTMLTALLNARKQTWLLLKVTALSLVSIVVAALPAVWLDRPDLSMIALPVFHGTLAIALSRSSGYGAFFWLDARVFKRTVVVALIAALALLANQTVNPAGNSWISACSASPASASRCC